MVAVQARGGAQLIENDALCPFVRQRVADRGRLGHCPALGQCQPHHVGLPRSSLTDQVGAPHARILNEATKRPFTRISDESTRSGPASTIVSMFESAASSQVMPLPAADDAGVVDAITLAGQDENAACARRLAWIGELYARRAPEDDDERTQWAIDGFENVVAEVSAALGISRGRAAAQLRYAIALRERLPRFAEVFATGVIDFRLMAAVVARTDLIEDSELLARLDAVLAKHAPKWMKLSQPKLIERIDLWVAKFDPAGVRVPNP